MQLHVNGLKVLIFPTAMVSLFTQDSCNPGGHLQRQNSSKPNGQGKGAGGHSQVQLSRFSILGGSQVKRHGVGLVVGSGDVTVGPGGAAVVAGGVVVGGVVVVAGMDVVAGVGVGVGAGVGVGVVAGVGVGLVAGVGVGDIVPATLMGVSPPAVVFTAGGVVVALEVGVVVTVGVICINST